MERESKTPRVCMISQRDVRHMAAWCSLYEFEDVISQCDDVHRIDLQAGPGFSWRKRAVSSLVWRQITPLSARLNPGLRPVTIDSEYDLFVFGCINPWELLFLNAVHGWKKNCRKKICFMYEMWAGIVPKYAHLLSLLNGFDEVYFGWNSSAQAVQKIVDVPCHHVSPAADALRFTPFPAPPERSIDVYSLGRRVESMHKQLLELADRREIFYVYDTLPGECLQPADHRQHRDLFANLSKRTKYFLTYPAKVDRNEETRGLSETGTRFYESVAAGAVLVGQAPDSESFKTEFGWPDSVINIGDRVDNLVEVMAGFQRNPHRFEQLTTTNAIEALKRHDWAYRWEQMLQIAGVPASEKLGLRKARLNQLATDASRTVGGLAAGWTSG